MIKLFQDKKKGWWIEVVDEVVSPFSDYLHSQRLAVTAEEVLSLLNQIKEQQPKLLKDI